MKYILAIAKKESLQALRDQSTLLIAVILPLLLLFLMGYAINLDSKDIKIALINHSNSANSKELMSAISNNAYFNASFYYSKDEAFKALDLGKIKAILEIEKDKILIIADGGDPNTAILTSSYLSSIINPQNPVNSRIWFNEKLSSRYFLIPGSVAVVITLIGTLLASLVIAKEWENNNLEVIFVAKISTLEFLIGKTLPYFALAMISMLVCFIVAVFWYEIPFRGSFLVLSVLSGCYVFTALSIGLLISTLTKNQFLSSQIAVLIGFLPAFLLSGYIFDISSMPKAVQFITYIFPASYYVNSLSNLFLVGNLWESLAKDMAFMLFFGLIFFTIALIKNKRQIA